MLVAVFSEHGTTVMTVAIRVVVYVLRDNRGQFVTEAAHFVIVSTTVDSKVEVVNEAGADVVLLTGDTTTEVDVRLGTEYVLFGVPLKDHG